LIASSSLILRPTWPSIPIKFPLNFSTTWTSVGRNCQSTKQTKILSVCQDIVYGVSEGRKWTPTYWSVLHITPDDQI
jgi:hypothetical protein